MSDLEMLERLESGEARTNSELAAELMRRQKEYGTSYENKPEDFVRWKEDTIKSHQKRMGQQELNPPSR